ncbi:sugar phosphate isomerase/epimerase family protein [Oceanobacillus kapialis]|uniref:Sugar phosphate isomerase/epimerase family protein n=1 Tax=Oceanobacillus kapialis TaxID=481353 RepID=A0ABW5Q3I7_9BACI
MKMFLSSPVCWAYPVDEVIRQAKDYQFDGVEIRVEQVWFYQTELAAIRKAKEETGLDISIHAPAWDLNLCSINDGIAKKSVEETEIALQLAHQLRATIMTMHPGHLSLANQFQELSHQKLVQNITYLAEKAEQLGVTISLEQMEPIKKEFITTPEATNELLSHLPETVKTTLDIAHVPLDRKPENDFQKLQRINNIHISDSTHSKYHVPLGEGEIAFTNIIALLKQSDLPVVLEGFDKGLSLEVLKQNVSQLQAFQLLRRETLENSSHQR